jgi:hypothetical protein
VALPDGYKIAESASSTTISWRAFQPAAYFLLFFAIGWNSFLLFWFQIGLSSEHKVPWIFFVFPIGHIAVGIGVIYHTLILFLNRTEIIVTDRFLCVRHVPIPKAKSVRLESASVRQVFCRERESESSDGQKYVRYSVGVLSADGVERKLIDGLCEKEQAIYIEQCIESRLKIQDLLVEGELPRNA